MAEPNSQLQKIIAALEVVIGTYLLYLLLNLVLYGCTYGLQGWNVSIQSSLHYASSIYNLTFLQNVLYLCNIEYFWDCSLDNYYIVFKCSNEFSLLQRLLLLASSASCQLCLILMIAFLFYKNAGNLPDFYASCKRYIFWYENIFRYEPAGLYDHP